jgi:sugar phosphate isomerase/epimerase
MATFPIGLQPFTVREELKQDYAGTLERIARIGYKGVELAPPPEGMSVAEQKALLDRLGLQVIGTHAGFNTLDWDPELIMDYLETVGGCKHIAISLLFHSKEDVLKKAEKLNGLGEQCRRRGYKLLYHNHDWEFVQYDGEYVLDIVLNETDPSFVQMELDTYWAAKGGVDPAAYLRNRLRGRCPLLHIKDMEAGEAKFFAEIGEGVLDFQEIAKAAQEAGVEWMVVEQDQCRRPPLESLQISYTNLRKLGLMKD